MKKYLTWQMLGWFLAGLVTFMLGGSAYEKVIGTTEMVTNFEYMKLSSYMLWVGLAEFLGLVLLFMPRTSIYGALLISCLMSAAAVMHLSAMGGAKVEFPIAVGLLAWTSHCLRAYTKTYRRKN